MFVGGILVVVVVVDVALYSYVQVGGRVGGDTLGILEGEFKIQIGEFGVCEVRCLGKLLVIEG